MILAFVGFLLFACSNDSDVKSNESTTEMIRYEEHVKSVSQDASIPTYEKIAINNLQNGKLFSVTHEVFLNGASQGTSGTNQHYFYKNNLLSSVVFDNDVRGFYYNGKNELIGADRKLTGNIYYRFVHQSDKVVFCEKLDLPYDDSSAKISHRYILEFDDNNNVVKAGLDSDLDGVMDYVNQYFYDNDNLVSAQMSNGNSHTYDYSSVINNFNVLDDNTFGKKS